MLAQARQHAGAEGEPAGRDQRACLYALDIHDLQVNQGIEPEEDGSMADERREGEEHVDTGGGAYVRGGVHTGGDFAFTCRLFATRLWKAVDVRAGARSGCQDFSARAPE